MNWQAFARAAPELAQLGEERIERAGLILLGSLRRNGWPRISPVEPLIVDGELYLGMIWQSRKALDLLRDPRCTVHSVVSNRDGTEGEFKLYGHANDVGGEEPRRRYGDALFAKLGWKPEGAEWHLFTVDIQSAAFVIIEGEERTTKVWKAA